MVIEMNIPKGYKQTEVGIIPEDWEVKTLSQCLDRPPRYGINAAAVPFDGVSPTYLRITDISDDGKYIPNPRVSVDHSQSSDYFLENGDIVFARTGASVGKSYRYSQADGPLVFAGFLIQTKPDESVLNSVFLSYYVQTHRYWSWVDMMSTRSGQPGINGKEYGELKLPVPFDIDEQAAIAEALSDTDQLIDSLDKLIAKKRNLKQAAMQQLLTGKTRLPGFDKSNGKSQQTEVEPATS